MWNERTGKEMMNLSSTKNAVWQYSFQSRIQRKKDWLRQEDCLKLVTGTDYMVESSAKQQKTQSKNY